MFHYIEDDLTARMKKSSCIQDTQPKLVYLKILSITHMIFLHQLRLAVNSVINMGTSAVDWWLGMNRKLSFLIVSKSMPLSWIA